MSRKRLILILILAVEAVLLVFGYNYWQEQNRLYGVLSGVEETLGVTSSANFSPSFPSSFETVSGTYGLSVVSMGRVSAIDLKSAQKREAVAKAGVLEVVTVNANGRTKKLNLAVQMASVADPQRNLMPWVAEKGAELASVELASADTMLSDTKLAEIFPEGSYLTFVPLTDLDREEIQESLPEYLSYASQYYGDALSKLKSFFDSNLSGSFNKVILVLDVF
ncbi:hypothetical protein GTO10_03825 [Candidatus Saccharibacteria bacterium]|nr:hypothetical protein [Candidatus Saccharibacteria bacterium]